MLYPNFGFRILTMIFPILFLLVFGIILAGIFRGMKEWNRNNKSPRLTVEATVAAKRGHVRRHDGHRDTSYFATFQVASGDRMELRLQGHEYGLLVEGDRGNLTFQGTRFLGFERI